MGRHCPLSDVMAPIRTSLFFSKPVDSIIVADAG
jgi:hypothetical protein